jgi:hypothetical protein
MPVVIGLWPKVISVIGVNRRMLLDIRYPNPTAPKSFPQEKGKFTSDGVQA